MTSNFDKVKWWENAGGFFGKYYKEADDSFEGHLNNPMSLSERTRREVNGIIKLSCIKGGAQILDCPSGYGRHSLELAKRGYDVTGVDINKEFLRLAEAERKKNSVSNCKFIEQDMRMLAFKNEFDLIINMFYSFGFFDMDKENEKVAQNFFKALKLTGKFLMHTHITVPRLISGKLKNNQIRQLKSGNKLKLERHYNPHTKREDGVWEILDKNNQSIELTPYSVRLYTTEEFKNLCLGVGFKEVKFYGSWSGEAYNDNSSEMIAVAIK